MSAIVKSWVRVHCPTCHERQVFVVTPTDAEPWRLVCDVCGTEKHLQPNGLIEPDASAPDRG